MALHIAFPILCRKRSHAAKRGFTLIEMAIVLVIIAVVVGVSMNVWRGKMDEAQVMQTRLKMAQIQKALMTYRRANDRLPCPADPTAVQNTANYGVAVTPPGTCNSAAGVIGNTTLPVFAVEGSVPYQTLNLPEDFMYDGWGKRIAYAVDPRMTEDEAFTNYDIYANCGGITVKDATGNPVTSSAIYAVISFGSNSHGAYTRGGTRYNGGSVNADELTNCNCTNNGTYSGSYGGIYIQKPMMGTGNATFDDMVEYQERWQLQTDADNVYGSYGGPEVGFSLSVSPYVKFYTKSCDTYTALNDPAALPPAAATGISVSPDNLYWAVSHGASPFVTIYQLVNNVPTKLANPATLPAGNGQAVAFSPTETYLAVGHADVANVTYLSIYQVNASNNTFTYLGGGSGPVSQPPAPVNAVAFSPEDIYLAVGVNAGNNLYVYKQSGGVFSTVGVTASATNAVTAVAFSRDNRYLAVGMSGGAKLVVYGVGDTFSSVNIGIVGGLPATAVTGVSFSYDNRYLAVSTNNATQSLYVYRIDPTSTTNTFTLVTGANSSYTGLNAVSASPRQHVITMAGNAAPFAAATKYVPIEDSFTLQGNSATVGFASQPLGAATGVTQRYLH